jgi:hypothetical protein
MYQIRHTDLSINKKVNAIKGLRQMTGSGLKEAKFAIDDLQGQSQNSLSFEPRPNGDTMEAQERNMREGIQQLVDSGYDVRKIAGNFEFDPLREGLTSLAKEAIDSDDLVLAQDLLRLAEDRQRTERQQAALKPGEFEVNYNDKQPVTLGDLIRRQMDESERNW